MARPVVASKSVRRALSRARPTVSPGATRAEAGTRVTISNPSTGFSRTITAGNDGVYRLALLPPGNYTVQAEGGQVGAARPNGARFARWLQDAGAGRQAALRVEHETQRLLVGGHEAHVQPRVVGQHGADTGQHGAGALAPGVAISARGFAGDPLAAAVGQGSAAVQRNGRLQPHERPAALHAREEADVEFAGRVGDGCFGQFDGDARRTQPCDALASHERIRVLDGHDDASDARRDQRVTTGRRAAVMRTGFQRDDGNRAAHVVAARRGITQRHDLGMRLAGRLRVAGTEFAAVGRQDDAADARVGVAEADGLGGQRQRTL